MAYLKKIFLIGGGGHSNSIYDLIESTKKYKIIGFVDLKNDNQFLSSKCQYLGSDEVIEELIKDYQNTVICIGQIKNSIKRIKIFNKLIKLKANLPVIISPFGYVSNSAKIDVGTVIMHGAVINSNSMFLISDKGDLVKLEISTGNLIWLKNLKTELNKPYFLGPILAGNRIWVVASDKTMRGYNVMTGVEEVLIKLAGQPSAPPVYSSNTIYIVTSTGELIAVQ